MDNDQIRTIVNHFCKMMGKVNLTPEDLKGSHIMLSHGNGFWDLTAEPGKRPKEAKLWLDFPAWDGEDILDLQIDVAGFLSTRLRGYFAKVKSNQTRGGKRNQEIARQAVVKRWQK